MSLDIITTVWDPVTSVRVNWHSEKLNTYLRAYTSKWYIYANATTVTPERICGASRTRNN